MNEPVIKCEKVSKKFSRSLNKSMIYGTLDVLQTTVGIAPKTSDLRTDEFWALDEVSFELKQGEVLGIIGPNGSGKTTLLRMLNGIFMPDRGSINIKKRVSALIQVGAGFHPMLSGRENIYINGSILGMSKAEIDRKFDAIVDFADIAEFLDAPVKHY
ncbi:MAG: lipopolysaccharide transport system ATP-binding protein, partial [Candidatus Omnitrophota bacterium]